MAPPDRKNTSPVSLLIDAVLVIAFFVFMYTVLDSHVPSNDKTMVMLWGGLASACLSAVFWLCVQMFRVTLRAQREDRRNR